MIFDITTLAKMLPAMVSFAGQDDAIPNPHLFRKNYRLGGVVEAEGGEVVDVPGMEAVELNGPSHEAGGIDLQLPDGSVVFSDKVKGPDGRTMAERKKSRDAQLKKVQEALKSNKADALHKETAARTFQTLMLEELEDIATMQEAYMESQQGKKPKARTGLVVGGGPDYKQLIADAQAEQELQRLMAARAQEEADVVHRPVEGAPDYVQLIANVEAEQGLQRRMAEGAQEEADVVRRPVEGGPDYAQLIADTQAEQELQRLMAARAQGEADAMRRPVGGSMDPTAYLIQKGLIDPGSSDMYHVYRHPLFAPQMGPEGVDTDSPLDGGGDVIDITAGDIAAVGGPLANTLLTITNRLGDRPTPNYYQNVGQEELEIRRNNVRGAAEGRDQEMQRNNAILNAIRRNRGARDITTARAFDIGALTEAGRNASRISQAFNRIMSSQADALGAAATRRDRLVAEGQKFADITDTQNRDAFATNLSSNISDITTGIQSQERNRLRRKLGIDADQANRMANIEALISELQMMLR